MHLRFGNGSHRSAVQDRVESSHQVPDTLGVSRIHSALATLKERTTAAVGLGTSGSRRASFSQSHFVSEPACISVRPAAGDAFGNCRRVR